MQKPLLRSLISTAATLAAFVAQAATPAPLGMTIGVTTCADATKRIDAPTVEGKDNLRSAESTNPGSLYPGATSAVVLCRGDKLDGVILTLGKGGMGNPAARDVYNTLSGKYKRVAGGPIPELGDGLARFESDGVVVQLNSPHLSFEFNVSYLSKQLWAQAKQRAQESDKAIQKAKTDGL